ncbi:hypothetical protein ABZP36_014785 [Zizania latifolia]
MDMQWFLTKRMDKFLLLKMKLLSAGENWGGHHSKFDADGHCVRITWEFFSGWILYQVVNFFPTAHYPDSAICDCLVIKLSVFCRLELFDIALVFCPYAWSSSVHSNSGVHAVVSSFFWTSDSIL